MKIQLPCLILFMIFFHATDAMQKVRDTFESRMKERKTNIAKTKERIEKTKERIKLLILKKQEYELKKSCDEFFSVHARENKQKNNYEIIFSRGSPKNGFRQKILYTHGTSPTYSQIDKYFVLVSHPDMVYLYEYKKDILSGQPKEKWSNLYLCDEANDIIEIKKIGSEFPSPVEKPTLLQQGWTFEESLSLFDEL